ncbi:UDP-N-acetylmuramyl-tripeptide synthetase [Tissierella sp. Yu-01]|uniref:Mur ligase family protein n=1 Tax=Tissierella sp. Yu-01 TaxID=3035694 RepID=UPI00240D7A9E|nr:UDP-N-acetylmuramyl-tripeptide synthetase [Tissierella sp. Yu-01]WFA07950.1 UDP-N-acetylmuramyl-tripeptide synthetase [Tissierella sp. Yu-01]
MKVGVNMNIKELLEPLNIIKEKNFTDDIEIKGIAYHSKRVEKEFIYVAIKGYITDGHKYVKDAERNGAVAVIVEDFVEECALPQFKVANSRESLSKISAKFHNYPSEEMKVIGVTATNGKTTTTYMLNQIYESMGYKTGLVGSVMNKVGEKFVPSELTTPESLDLQKLFREMRDEDISIALMEVSSSALELYRVNDVDYDIVSFNNFSREHIDQHGSFEKYWEAKSSLVRNAKKGSYALLNIDDEHIRTLVDKTDAYVVTYSTRSDEAMIYVKDLELVKGRAKFTVVIKEDYPAFGKIINKNEFEINLGIPGLHSVENAMVATVIALTDGVPVDVIQRGLSDFAGVERRFEYIYERDFLIIDDHFANLKNINVSLETLSQISCNNLHLIYAIRGNRGVTVNRENAEALVAWKDKLKLKEIVGTKSIGSVTSKDTVSEEEEKVFTDIIKSAGIKLTLFDKLDDAINYTLKKTNENDIVLLAGCQGMDNGAKIALDYIHQAKPTIRVEELYKPLRGRASN